MFKVRLIDASGSASSVGLLQIKLGSGEYGTVCGMNLAAADVACRQMGYDFGSVSSSPCGSYGGSSLCGASGTPVAMKGLACTGGELNIQECSYEEADGTCAGHGNDAIVYCGAHGSGNPKDGALRLLAADGSPSVSGEGRLEMFRSGAWAPVCSSGFTDGAESVSCKSMGFAGVRASGVRPTCTSFGACGTTPPQTSELSCTGRESDILDCSFEDGDDVFCAPEVPSYFTTMNCKNVNAFVRRALWCGVLATAIHREGQCDRFLSFFPSKRPSPHLHR